MLEYVGEDGLVLIAKDLGMFFEQEYTAGMAERLGLDFKILQVGWNGAFDKFLEGNPPTELS
jgi:hypothetical protein